MVDTIASLCGNFLGKQKARSHIHVGQQTAGFGFPEDGVGFDVPDHLALFRLRRALLDGVTDRESAVVFLMIFDVSRSTFMPKKSRQSPLPGRQRGRF